MGFNLSDLDVRPVDFVLLEWVKVGWVAELSVVVLFVQSLLDSLGDSQEVGNVETIGEVLVQVVLVVLDLIQVLVNKVVSSNSWEGEGLVVQF